MENKYYVYAHYKTGEPDIPFYIGKGHKKRAWSKNNRNTWWKNIVAKHGFEVRLLAEHISEEDAIYLEIQLIGMFGRADLGKGPLVNMTDGGDGTSGVISARKGKAGKKHTEEWKRAKSIAMKGNQHLLGYKPTDETKQVLRDAFSGDKNPMFGMVGNKCPSFGKKWIYNIETLKNDRIGKDCPVPDGWELGKKHKHKHKHKHSEETKAKGYI